MVTESVVVLDTNAVVELFSTEPNFQRFISAYQHLAIPATVLGELYFGAYKSGRAAANLASINRLLTDSNVEVISTDAAVAMAYGAIRDELRRVGRPIPVNDIWIAAVARQRGLPLVSRDIHFDVVPGLSRLAW